MIPFTNRKEVAFRPISQLKWDLKFKKVKVTLEAFPDYVFKPNYKLRSLKETEEFIAQNGHLPEVPCAEEVAENGADLGELNKILLKKVEELTLHLIRMQKEIEELKKGEMR
jgi:hypothetical protein